MKTKRFALLTCILLFTQALFAQATEIQYLSGKGFDDAVDWQFECTGGRRSGEKTTVKVPSCWELQGFGTYQYGMPFYGKANPPGIADEKGLYKVKFRLPKEWEGRVIRLVFDGVMTDCEATINGRSCVKLHQGSFYRFRSDISDRIFFGERENLLEVTVSKESANPSVNLAERRADYWNFGGIFRPVFIEALPAQFIDRTAINALANGEFNAEIFLGAATEKSAKIRLEINDKNGKAIGKIEEHPLAKGSDKVLINSKLTNIKQWSAETPELYKATFSLIIDGKATHSVTERFGFRTIEVRASDGLYINGQKVLVRGINRHSFRPETGRTLNRTANFEDVRLIKSMNMNAVRLSHYPPDIDFLEACDELGLYVMDELAGWHGMYDSNVGKKLVKEMLTRDMNHPSIIWWSNGNEGGHNLELDAEFTSLDLQGRPVLHPQKNFGGFETMHYRSFGESLEYMRKPEIYMPTEILHGLYDGGHGAGLFEYWEIIRNHSRSAGAFLWDLADEGVVRTDLNGKIDNSGNYGADGIVGPHHEKEGSYFTVKQVWSPVQIMISELPENFDGTLPVENRYDFTNLKECKFIWTLKSFANRKETVVKSGEIAKPDIPPHSSGKIKIDLPKNWKDADALYIAVFDAFGEELWTWDYKLKKIQDLYSLEKQKSNLSITENDNQIIVIQGNTKYFFDRKSGYLSYIEKSGKRISIGNGPRFIAARRGDRSMDVYYNHDDKEAKSKERIYFDISKPSIPSNINHSENADSITVSVNYSGDMKSACWHFYSDGPVRLDYEYQYSGTVELMGVCFNYPESLVQSKRFLGKGPYRVWQNRLLGGKLGIWTSDYNDPVPGETFTYPEFKGYFADWSWMEIETAEGAFTIANGSGEPYIGVFTPRDGRDAVLYTLPESGIAALKVIPAVRNKVNSTDLVGPSSQAQWVFGTHRGSLYLQF